MKRRFVEYLRAVALIVGALAGGTSTGCSQPNRDDAMTFAMSAQVVAAYPHDRDAFTQGLTVHNGRLFEGTGQYGRSSLREVDLETGAVERIVPLNRAFFGEGITVMGDSVYQLTWLNGIGAVYDLESFEVTATFRYEGEGWGLTDDGELLIMSDGTPILRFIDPSDFSVVRELEVRGPNGPVERLNELEYVRDEVWANVWYEDVIVRIDPESGDVLGTIDLGSIYPAGLRGREQVANGIAFAPDTNKVFVTGKNWPQLFEIRLVPADD